MDEQIDQLPLTSLPLEVQRWDDIVLRPTGMFSTPYGEGKIFIAGDYWRADAEAFAGQMVSARDFDPLAALILFCDAVRFHQE